jgi:hypothetical protein
MTESMKYITGDAVVSLAAANLGVTNPPNQQTWKQWAYDAQRHIGFNQLYQMEKEVLIEDLRIPIPTNMAEPISIRITCNVQNPNGYPQCVYPSLQESRFSCVCCEANRYGYAQITMTEQDGYWILSSNALYYEKAEILYWSFPIIDGELLFPEYNSRALAAYVEYMHIKQGSNLRDDNMMEGKVNRAYQNWIVLKRDAIGHELTPSLAALKEIAQAWAGALPIDVRLMSLGTAQRGIWNTPYF